MRNNINKQTKGRKEGRKRILKRMSLIEYEKYLERKREKKREEIVLKKERKKERKKKF